MSTDHPRQYLFTYGTLRDQDVQQLLFGFSCPPQPARLPGWAVYADDNGYLFIKPDPAGSVGGGIIEVDNLTLTIADQWEEVPRYRREKVVVELDDGADLEAWAYTRCDGEGTIYSGTRTSLLDRQTVLAEARRFATRR